MDGLAMRDRGGANMSVIKDMYGRRLTNEEAAQRMPVGGYRINTMGGGGGYQGRGHINAHIGAPMGPRTGPLSPDYGAYFGGLNEFNQNQQTMGEYDRLQNRAAMDRQDAIGSRMAQQQRAAIMSGDYETAAQFSDALNDRIAQRIAAQGGNVGAAPTSAVSAPPAQQDMYHAPGEKKTDAQGNVWRWNQATGHGEMIEKAPTLSDVTPPPIGTWMGGENLGEGTLYTPYGTASVTQGPRKSPATFTDAQGYMAPGGVYVSPTPRVEEAEDFFQGAADRQRRRNRFAQPGEGYGGSMELGSYADRLLEAKKRLGGA